MSDAPGNRSNERFSGKRRWLPTSVAAALLLAAPVSVEAQGVPAPDELEAQEPEPVEAEAAEPEADPEQPVPDPAAEEAAPQPEADSRAAADPEGDDEQAAEQEASPEVPDADEREEVAVGREHLVEAGLNVEGARGFQGMASAIPGKRNTYGVGFVGEMLSGSDLVRANDDASYLAGNLLLQANVLEYLSVNFGIKASSHVNTFGRPQSMLAQGDMHLGLRGHYEAKDGYHVAVDLTTYFPSSFESGGVGFAGTSVRPRMLFSVDFAEALGPVLGERPLDLITHFNFGYRFDNTDALVPENVSPTRVERFAYGLSAYDYLEMGLGAEYRLPYVSPFASWRLDVPLGADDAACSDTSPLDCVNEAGPKAFPQVLSLGAKAEPVQNLGLTAGVDLGLTSEDVAGVPVTAPWRLILGATWTVDPEPKIEYVEKTVVEEKIIEKEPPRAHLLGSVVNAENGEAVGGAIIRYAGVEDAVTPQASSATGDFRSYGFAPGAEVEVMVTHPDYKSGRVVQVVDKPEEYEVSVELEPVPKLGVASGTILDQEGEPIPDAQISLSGPMNRSLRADSNGGFSQRLRAGEYTVAVAQEGYLTGGRDISVNQNKEVQIEITLKPAPEESLVEVKGDRIQINDRVFFETGNAKILPRSYNVLDQVASVLIQNAQIKKLSIEGHTDDVGADDSNLALSQSRAESVRDYLVEQGVGEKRIVAEGFGESKPLVPNTSSRNRGLNRRVEFRIVDQQEQNPTTEDAGDAQP